MSSILEIIFTLIPIILFLYLSLTMLGVIKYNSQTSFLENASTTTKIAVYGGTIAFIIMAVKDLL
ncbi:hypothetical protein ABID22_003295 [Pontibacter aydingkolensis]|uniref:Cytochrome oxidase subunit II transmembrane region profile domain-containing protein n=1 Tax=Pontibacter aydingkolensis TaxID=1911536 RepID=A0ABS7CUF5_9BACT|nr:hypothetical protein [Pontibacter aydingkolensis]MBW7467435.1 hypothetical protein [Pontibacter aydingkolensis]